MSESTEVTVLEPPKQAEAYYNPMVLIQTAIERGVSPDDLGKLFDLQARYEDRRSQEAYAIAKAGFQKDCPPITKDKSVRNRDGSARNKYAAYETIKSVTKPIEEKWGISISFSTPEVKDGIMSGYCRVRVGSYYEDTHFHMPIPTEMSKMGMNPCQQFGTALSYFRRYAYCAALDIVVQEEDTDANDMTFGECLDDKESQIIETLITQCVNNKDVKPPFNRARFFAWVSEKAGGHVNLVQQIPRQMFAEVQSVLKRKAGVK